MKNLETRLEEFGLNIINEEVTKIVTLEDFQREFGRLDFSKATENEYGNQDLIVEMIDENDEDYSIEIEFNPKNNKIINVFDKN